MIEINLLPGTTRKARGLGAGLDLKTIASDIGAKVKDPYLAGAVGGAIAAVAIVGMLHTRHLGAEEVIQGRYEVAQADSTRYAAVIADRRSAEAQRDSVIRQIDIIRAIDDDRFVWPHILEEVSRALPAYTWLTSVRQTSAVVTAASSELEEGTKKKAAAADSGTAVAAGAAVVPDGASRAPKFRVVGQTVDIQALTLFMKQMEASPFIKRVQLARSDVAIVDGKQLTEFHLDAEYEVPPQALLRTVPINLVVR